MSATADVHHSADAGAIIRARAQLKQEKAISAVEPDASIEVVWHTLIVLQEPPLTDSIGASSVDAPSPFSDREIEFLDALVAEGADDRGAAANAGGERRSGPGTPRNQQRVAPRAHKGGCEG
jgi:hypothetical protein